MFIVTSLTLSWFWHVSLHVEGQVVGPGEGPLADLAFEWLCSRVFPVVSGQLVRPREPPLTLGPVTAVRLLSWRKSSALDRVIITAERNE